MICADFLAGANLDNVPASGCRLDRLLDHRDLMPLGGSSSGSGPPIVVWIMAASNWGPLAFRIKAAPLYLKVSHTPVRLW
jgi:hypothetical protein